jgi:HSP20 family molecular chaperone IbpA
MSNLSIWSDNATANQWRGLMDLQRNLDLVFDRAFGNVKIDPWDDETVFHPAVDMEETDSHYVMNVDLTD